MPEPVLIVDVQRGFINDFTQHAPGRIKRLIETGDYSPVEFDRAVGIRYAATVRYRLVQRMASVIGKSLLRREDRPLLLGQGQYVADLQLPGTLHMAVVRSMYPHA